MNWPQKKDGRTTILPYFPSSCPPHPEVARLVTDLAIFANDEPLDHRSSGENGLGGKNGNEPTLVEIEITT